MDSQQNTIIVVARNNVHLTRAAVTSALAQDIPVRVMLIDNASTDGTADWARTKSKLLRITFPEQKSLSYCWNYGLQQVFRRDKWNNRNGGGHTLVINNDVELRSDTYRQVLLHGGPFVTAVSVNDLEQLGESTPYEASIVSNDRPHPDFSCFLIRRECWEVVGKFNEDYFPAYVEDAEYHIRMHRAGVPAVCIDLPFLHHGAGTLKHADEAEKKKIQRGADANRERFRKVYGCLPGTKEYEALFQ